ncbi:MAG: ATP-binding cassette domain-containing protein [Gammaproteobacteria bacterium]|jgi:putative ABC transport system ATP-binding protein|nr:ATP-binding cassette domain-containing protein [Gammaproteobacteria bacterium]
MNEPTRPLIRLRDLKRIYTTEQLETHALDGIDLDIDDGEYVAVEGPSGCGKSTLLSVLGLLDEASGGEYRLAGVPVTDIDAEEQARLRNREIGFIFQSFNLIPEMTVRENVELPLIYRGGLTTTARRQAVDEALARVDMSARAEHRPAQLSGGQQQRAAIARALVGKPSLLLADEPTGNLDSASGERIMQLLDELHADGSTLVMVTHDPDYAARAGRRVRMKDGRIDTDGSVAA